MTNKIKRLFVEDTYNVEVDKEVNILDHTKKSSDLLEYRFKQKFEGVEDKITSIYKNINYIKDKIESDVSILEYKIKQAVEKLRASILVERNTTTAIYTTTIPINTYNTETTTATIKDGIAFGISDTKIATELIKPLTRQDLSFKNLNIKTLNQNKELTNVVIDNKTTNREPFEFSIDLRDKIPSTASVILDLKDFSIIEVYVDGILYKEKTLDKYFNIPVNINNSSISFRSYPTIHQSSTLRFNVIGMTEYTCKDASIYESKPLNISKQLTKMVLDTCDNNTDSNVNIEYYISINGGSYEKTKAVSKNRRKEPYSLQSVLTLSKDTDNDMLEMNGYKVAEGDIRYYIPNSLENYIQYETTVYSKENINYKNFYIQATNDIVLHKDTIKANSVYIDGYQCTTNEIYINKGIRHIVLDTVDETVLKQLLNGYDVYSTVFNKTVYSDIQLSTSTASATYKYITLTPSELISTFNSMDLGTLYIKDTKKSLYVNTVQIKAILNSLDKKTVPYIDRILLRGL